MDSTFSHSKRPVNLLKGETVVCSKRESVDQCMYSKFMSAGSKSQWPETNRSCSIRKHTNIQTRTLKNSRPHETELKLDLTIWFCTCSVPSVGYNFIQGGKLSSKLTKNYPSKTNFLLLCQKKFSCSSAFAVVLPT